MALKKREDFHKIMKYIKKLSHDEALMLNELKRELFFCLLSFLGIYFKRTRRCAVVTQKC